MHLKKLTALFRKGPASNFSILSDSSDHMSPFDREARRAQTHHADHVGNRRLEACLGEVGIEFAHFSPLRDEGGVRRLGIFGLDLNQVSNDFAPSSFSTKAMRVSTDFFV
jgi:hypothetical protein